MYFRNTGLAAIRRLDKRIRTQNGARIYLVSNGKDTRGDTAKISLVTYESRLQTEHESSDAGTINSERKRMIKISVGSIKRVVEMMIAGVVVAGLFPYDSEPRFGLVGAAILALILSALLGILEEKL